MKVAPIIVQAFEVTDPPALDPVRFYLQDLGSGRGRLIVECYGAAWSCYWGAMGDRSLREFLIECSAEYLETALHSGLTPTEEESRYLTRIVKVVKDSLVGLKTFARVGDGNTAYV